MQLLFISFAIICTRGKILIFFGKIIIELKLLHFENGKKIFFQKCLVVLIEKGIKLFFFKRHLNFPLLKKLSFYFHLTFIIFKLKAEIIKKWFQLWKVHFEIKLKCCFKS